MTSKLLHKNFVSISIGAQQEQVADILDMKADIHDRAIKRPQWLTNLHARVGPTVYALADCIAGDLDIDCMQSMIGCGVDPSFYDCINGVLCGGWSICNRCRRNFG